MSHTIDPNGTDNYKWCLAHDIRQTVANMSADQKQQALQRIEERRIQSNFFETPYDRDLYLYITTLLNNKEPAGISRRA